MDTYLCYKCISDSFLSRVVEAEGDQETCRVCGEVREAISIERLGQILEPVMRENFGPGEEFPVLDDNDRVHYQQRGDSIAYGIQEVMGQYFDFEDEIVDAIIEADDYWPPDGGEPYWEDTQDYEKIQHTTAEFLSNWHNILAEIKHNRRFFSQRAEAFFTDLFDGVEHMTLPRKPRTPVVRRLRVGSKLFRARVVSSVSVSPRPS
jgi:hypothetical protein